MKLSLDELKVDSYAVQVSETELAEVKGGTGWQCVANVVPIVDLIMSAYQTYLADSTKNSGGAKITASGGSGGGAPQQINFTFTSADSVKIYHPDGTITTVYGIK